MGIFRRRSRVAPREVDTEPAPAIGGERIVFWKTKEQLGGIDYGPVWIANASDPNETLEDPELWVTWEEAEEFARRRGLPIEDV